jgi:uncharacterized lipoprotein YmbA
MTVEHSHGRRMAAILLAAALTGCATSPPPRTLVIIPSMSGKQASAPSTRPSFQISVGTISLPEHLQHRSVRYLNTDTELVAWPSAVWAERLEVGLTRRLIQGLSTAWPDPGWWAQESGQTQARLLVDVRVLDMVPSTGKLSATVDWRLINRRGQALASGTVQSNRKVSVTSATDQAAAMGQWVDEVSDDMVQHLPHSLPGLSDTSDSRLGAH